MTTIMKTKKDLINWINRIQRNGQGTWYYQNGAGISIASDWGEISALIETISSDEYLNDIEIVDKNGIISDDTSIEIAFNSMPKDDFADTDFFAKVTHDNGYNAENFDIFIQVYK